MEWVLHTGRPQNLQRCKGRRRKPEEQRWQGAVDWDWEAGESSPVFVVSDEQSSRSILSC